MRKRVCTLPVVGLALIVFGLLIIVTTWVAPQTNPILFYNNAFRFVVQVTPDVCVNEGRRGYWVKTGGKGGILYVAINFPLRGHEVEFGILQNRLDLRAAK